MKARLEKKACVMHENLPVGVFLGNLGISGPLSFETSEHAF
jgi:hypothetical protein